MIGIKAKHSQKLESLTNIKNEGKRYYSLCKESKALSAGMKSWISILGSLTINYEVSFSQNPKCQRLEKECKSQSTKEEADQYKQK